MKTILTIPDLDNLYEVTISKPSIMRVVRYMEDSGISREVSLDELPARVRDKILKELKEV
jgi:hypothetical protein